MTFVLASPAFDEGAAIPRRHARAGLDLSPPLSWSGAPEGARAFALSVEDPDAPGGLFVHWLLYDLPARCRMLREGISKSRHLEEGARQGTNGYGAIGWGGPDPPSGERHRYCFTLFALSAPLGIAAGIDRDTFYVEVQRKLIGSSALSGTFG